MPLLADVIRDTRQQVVTVTAAEDRRFEFESLDGATLIDWSGGEFIDRAGITGIDVNPLEVIRDQIPGLPGSRLQEIRDLEREVMLPVSVRPADRDYRTMLKRLDSLRAVRNHRLVDYVAAEGVFDLAAYSARGRRTLRCTYLEGLEGDYGADTFFAWWRILGIRMLAVDPFWRGIEWSTPWVSVATSVPFLSSNPAAHPWGLAPSVVLGTDMPVLVGGDIPSPAAVELIGPATSMHVTSSGGLDVTTGAVPAGSRLVVDSGRRKRVELDGASRWDLLTSDSPQWQPLPPGDTTISVEVVGATSATQARVYGTELWETWC